MDTKVVVYTYTETILGECFTENIKPAVLAGLVMAQAQERATVFKQCGGLKITDYFKNEKTHIRKSYWLSSEGYQKWLQNEKTLNYLKARSDYQKANQITELLEGPFEASLDD